MLVTLPLVCPNSLDAGVVKKDSCVFQVWFLLEYSVYRLIHFRVGLDVDGLEVPHRIEDQH